MRVLVFLCLAFVPFIQCKKIHEYMTPDEVMSIFHTTHDSVPEYEVVPLVHSRRRREVDATQMKVTVFGEDLDLYLQPTEGYLAGIRTPLWTARSNPRAVEGVSYKLERRAMATLGVTLQDKKSSAAVLATALPNGRAVMDGMLSPTLLVRSVPARVANEVMYGENGLYEPHYLKNATEDGDFVYTYHHIVYKSSLPNRDMYFANPPADPNRQVPEVIYPQVLIVVDYNLYLTLGKDIEHIKRYVIAFWNGVDLRYRQLTHPKIRLNIAGIVLALDADAVPYVEQNRVDVAMVDADKALRAMGSYMYRETRFPHAFYDMAITMTQLDLCNMVFAEICDPGTIGYAFVAGACDRNQTKQSSEAVGLVEDNGGFSGIIPAAHEIGHLMGARHDGNAKDGLECPPYEGFIMTSGLLLEERGFEWSTCSLNAFYKFLNEDRAKCLYNRPWRMTQVARFLPGKLMSPDDQCRKVLGAGACNKNSPTICTRLECEVPDTDGFCRAIAPAAEGSTCGEDMFCINGKCVLEGTNDNYDGPIVSNLLMRSGNRNNLDLNRNLNTGLNSK